MKWKGGLGNYRSSKTRSLAAEFFIKLKANSNYIVSLLFNDDGVPVAILAIIKKDSNSLLLDEQECISKLAPKSLFKMAGTHHYELCETGPNAKPYSFLALPIMDAHNVLIGVIRIPRHENTGVFTKDDIKLIESITDRISTILEKENYLKANLNTLAEINHQINSSTKIEDILNSILVAVTDNLGFSFSLIHLVDETKGIIKTEKERFKSSLSKIYKSDELGKESPILDLDSLDRRVELSKFDSKTRKLLLAHNILLPCGTKKYVYFSNVFLDETAIQQALIDAEIDLEFHAHILFLWRNSHIDVKSWVLSIREAIVITGDSPRLNLAIEKKNICQHLTRCFVPIISIQNRIGVLEAGQDTIESGVISSSKIELLKALSNQASIAINNSKLQKIIKTQLNDKTYEVNVLDDVGKIISSTDSFDSILKVIYTNISEALKKRDSHGVNIGIFLYEARTNSLELYQPFSMNTNPPPYGEKFIISLSDCAQEIGLVGCAFKNKETIYVKNTNKDKRYRKITESVRSELDIPLLFKNECIGILNVESDIIDGFNPSTRKLLERFSRQAAIAINSAQLAKMEKETNEKLKTVLRLITHQTTRHPVNIIGLCEELKEDTLLSALDRNIYYSILSNEAYWLCQDIHNIDIWYKLVDNKIEDISDNRDKETISLKVEFENIKNSLDKIIKEKSLEFVTEINDEHLDFSANKYFATTILSNLVENSVKYCGVGGVIKLKNWLGKRHLYVSITDNGIGIPKKDKNQITQPLKRGSNVEKQIGSGLGMYIVDQLCKILGWTLIITSPIFKSTSGTKITIRIPRERVK